MATKRIGILTGGGDCPGLNAAIRAVVKAGIGIYNLEIYGIETGFEGLIQKLARPLALEDVRGILNKGGTILGATRRHDPFHYPEKVGEETKTVDCSRLVLQHASALGLDALVVLGGDGTLTIAERLWQMGLPLVAIPKTIDNDLSGTDVAIGFRTAVMTAMEALDKLHSTAESHHRVMVVELMGNKAGWIALESGIAGGADVILIPEIPFTVEKACEKIIGRMKLGRPFSIVVVSEGAKAVGHQEVYIDPQRHRLGGISQDVATEIEKCTGLETRVLVLGHLQRGGSPSSFDRVLASRFGVHALELIVRREFGKMVALREAEVAAITIQQAIAKLHTVDPNGDLASTAEALGISLGK
ncbi:6-phosphofructokinase [bacterium]|nr:MAG: 6-phosphofructokinase [bacterium]